MNPTRLLRPCPSCGQMTDGCCPDGNPARWLNLCWDCLEKFSPAAKLGRFEQERRIEQVSPGWRR